MSISYSEFQQAQQDLELERSRETSSQVAIVQYQNTKNKALAAGDTATAEAADAKIRKETEYLNETRSAIATLQSKVDSFYGSSTVKSESEVATEKKYADPARVVSNNTPEDDSGELKEPPGAELDTEREVPGVPPGAELPEPDPPFVIFKDKNGKKLGNDLRVKIRVPTSYLVGRAAKLRRFQGVLFPYTPTIGYEYKADYSAPNVTHSNFAINFYQRSTVSAINIGGKFSVENYEDAEFYTATVHLLKSLTKMRFGGASSGDIDSGAPPPVCRLDAYGDDMLNNVPVAITSVKIDLPDGVDYFTYGGGKDDTNPIESVPVLSTIQVTCLPMYSRAEMQNFSVTKYLTSSVFRKSGFF